MTEDASSLAPLVILTALLGAVVAHWFLQRARDAKLSASLEAPWSSSQLAGGSPPHRGREWLRSPESSPGSEPELGGGARAPPPQPEPEPESEPAEVPRRLLRPAFARRAVGQICDDSPISAATSAAASPSPTVTVGASGNEIS